MTAVSFAGAAIQLAGRTILHDVSFDVAGGEFVAILGPNGAGKSTLIRTILGQIPLAAGTLEVLDAQPGRMNHAIGYLPQRRAFDSSQAHIPGNGGI